MLTILLALACAPSQEAGDQPLGRVVLVRAGENLLQDIPRFASGLCASRVAGQPACLLVEDELREEQQRLLARLPDHELIVLGSAPRGLAQEPARTLDSLDELVTSAERVVLTSQHVSDILEAAPEAWRRGVPLIIARPGFVERLAELGTSAAWVVAPRQPVTHVPGVELTDLSDAAERWSRLAEAEDEPYLAAINAYPGRSWTTGSILGATLLAARHRGLVLSIDEPVEFLYANLTKQRKPPQGLEDVDVRRWIAGEFELDGETTAVAAPQVGIGPAIMGTVRKYGDPVVDLDGDGVLEPESETVALGDVATLGGLSRSFSLRLMGSIRATKFYDGMRTQRAVAVSPPAEVVAERLKDVYGDGALPAGLLIAGDHREIPFDYVRDPVYAATIMHEQELASDNLYADPDGDGYLDLAVGRFVSTDPVGATTLALRMGLRSELRDLPRPEATLIYPAWPADELEHTLLSIFASFEALLHGLDMDLAQAGFATNTQLREAGALDEVVPHLEQSSLILFAHHSGPDTWTFRVLPGEDGMQLEQLISDGRLAAGVEGQAIPALRGAPLIVGAGCDSAGLDYEVPFARSVVHAFFESGAVAYLGNTRAGIPDTEEFLIRHTLQGVYGMLPHPREPLPLGEAFRRGKNLLGTLITDRGPFRSVEPFSDQSLSMRREWSSLVLYGDPLQRFTNELAPSELPLSVRTPAEGGASFTVEFTGELSSNLVWIMEEVAVGPLTEIASLSAPGLSYSNVPWATFPDSSRPATVGPGVFLDLPWPKGAESVVLEEGPDWSLGSWRRLTDARGRERALISLDVVRYAMAIPEEAEVARRVVVRFE